ncbi:LacI family DNA-binding transcriptional regulator [Aliishimia ponticola]|uniref:LacI family DNA-binding transcriptional regulator n=1 Tax=Aliishimia ponticola TaxID=2499833 RepID=A0A4S4NBR1_9RHOB|nr:LacI family DNA-binding transcriptional regulator [Aliishimia ponticola]THH36779.1 LacI family DNA-binding transcriptional regulator [Aliishimia ponticola]
MSNPPGRIRDVAKETGLSIATISRVMNGSKNVSPQTRQRVLEACERLDYLPNPAARALSTAKSRTVAAIIPTIEHSVFAKFISGIENTLSAQDYSLVMAISNGDPEEELAAARKLLGMGAEGFILSGAAHSPALLDLLERRRVPFALTSVWDAKSTHPTIGYDNSALAAEAVDYLSSLGHRRIVVIHGPLSNSDRTLARREGAQSRHSGGTKMTFIETDLSVTGGRKAISDVLAKDDRPTAVLCFSDVLALGVYFGLAEAGLRIPEDMSVMGFDNLDWAKETHPALTTINLPAAQIGRAVAAQFIDHLENGAPLRSTHLEAAIVQRASVKDIRGSDAG